MGAILAIFGNQAQAELDARNEDMISCSDYRGQAHSWLADRAVISIQSLGWDASLATFKNWTVAFHGFIGNWGDISRENRLHFGKSDSDALRLAKAYAQLGNRLIPKLRGEFAFIVYDTHQRSVLAVRDVIGTRPLFYQANSDVLIFASEIRQVLAGSKTQRKLNEIALAGYLMNRPIPDDQTLDRHVLRVVPGQAWTFRTLDSLTPPETHRYWLPPPSVATRRYDQRSLQEELRSRLQLAVARSVPDHPFAVTLSGGLDSSSVWSLVAYQARQGCPHAVQGIPYSLVHPGMSCDESGLIADIRRHTQTEAFVEIDASRVDPAEYIEPYYDRIDGSLNNGTAFHLPLLASHVRGEGRRTLLLGTGEQWPGGNFRHLADDLRGGHWLDLLYTIVWAKPYLSHRHRRLRFLLKESGLRWPRCLAGLRTRHQVSPSAQLLTEKARSLVAGMESINQAPPGMSHARWYLESSLAEEQSWRFHEPIEQMAALESVELRQPLYDLDLIGFAFSVPPRAFTGGVRQKHLLRCAMGELLPDSLHALTQKVSFNEVADSFLACMPLRNRWRLVDEGFLEEGAIMGTSAAYARAAGQGLPLAGTTPGFVLHHQAYLAERFAEKYCT